MKLPGTRQSSPKNNAKTALRASDPVLFLEHKLLFSAKGPVPLEEYYLPVGIRRLHGDGPSRWRTKSGHIRFRVGSEC